MMKKLLLEEALFEDEVTDDISTKEPSEEETTESTEKAEPSEGEDTSEEPNDGAGEETEVTDEEETEEEGEDLQTLEPETTTYKVTFTLGNHTNWSKVDTVDEKDAEQLVSNYVTKKWPNREFEIIDVEEFKDVQESLNEDLSSKYSDIFYGYVKHLTSEDNYDDLTYLVNQLIRYCEDEDLKDLWYDRVEKIATEGGFNSGTTEESFKEDYDDELSKARRYLDLMIPETCREVESKIDGASDGALLTINSHCLRFTSAMEDMLEYFSANESLNESVTDAQVIAPGAAIGMASLISDLIKDEYEAVDGYISAIATAAAEGYDDMIPVLSEIQAEENVHIGQLQALMNIVDPNSDKVEEGRQEGEEQLSNPLTNMSEDWHNMNDREYARMEEITNKFHKLSAKQFMDLYISGTIKATFVQDSDDIPGYNETIDIDSTDLSQGTGNVMAYVMLSPVDGKLYGYVSY